MCVSVCVSVSECASLSFARALSPRSLSVIWWASRECSLGSWERGGNRVPGGIESRGTGWPGGREGRGREGVMR